MAELTALIEKKRETPEMNGPHADRECAFLDVLKLACGRLRLSCSQRGSDFFGRPIVGLFLGRAHASWGLGPLTGPQRDLLPKQKDIFATLFGQFILFSFISPIVTKLYSHSLPSVFMQSHIQKIFSKHHV